MIFDALLIPYFLFSTGKPGCLKNTNVGSLERDGCFREVEERMSRENRKIDHRAAHRAAMKDLKDFILLKNFSGKLNMSGLALLTLIVLLLTGEWFVLVFSLCLLLISLLNYYATRLATYFKDKPLYKPSDEEEDTGAEAQKNNGGG